MASAPAPRASTSAKGSFWFPSRTLPLEPTQIAPDFSTTGSKAAASPPVMGSLALPRATRFETTTRFTGPLLLVTRELTSIHQYGSSSPFQRNETKFGLSSRDLTGTRKKENFTRSHRDRAKEPCSKHGNATAKALKRFIAARSLAHHRADAREIPAHRLAHRNVQRRLARGVQRKMQ